MKTKERPATTTPAILPDMWQSRIRGRINPGTEKDADGFRKLNSFEHYLRETFLLILQTSTHEEVMRYIGRLTTKERNALLQKCRLTGVIRSSVSRNPKTLFSFDPSACPRKLAGNPCAYCYTLSSSFKMPSIILPYELTREITRLPKKTIARLNSMGGIRIFSRGDYNGTADTDRQIEIFLQDCRERNLLTKAITKNLLFVDRHHDNPGLTTINISLDRFETVPFKTAIEYRRKYENVSLRFVILNNSDMAIAEEIGNCLLTFGHGNKCYTAKGFHAYTKEEKIRLAGNMPTCCVTGKVKPHHYFNEQMIEIQTCENCIYGCTTERKEN